MSSYTNDKRVFALDVRPRSFGYVVFEGPDRLLDWGVRSFRKGVNSVRVPLATKIAALLEEFHPAIVVTKEAPSRKKVNRAKSRRVLEVIRHKASIVGIKPRVFSRRVVRNPFGGEERLTRYRIATALAERFSELAPILPPKRKCYQSEDYRMSIFDAAALGVAYFARCAKHTSKEAPVPQEPS